MKQRVYRNFGTPHPEGYRKAMRIMQVAEKFRRPIFTLVDTDGAYPGIHAEERGQAEAIAYNLREMARLEVPIIATVIGVGRQRRGACQIAVADRVLMMENSIYFLLFLQKAVPPSCGATPQKKNSPPKPCALRPRTWLNSAALTISSPNPKAERIAIMRRPPTCSMSACRNTS